MPIITHINPYIKYILRYLQHNHKMQDLIMSQIQALQISMAPLESGATLSYQEQNQMQIVGMYRKYFHNVKQAYLKCPQSKLHQKLLQEYTLLGNSLWSECQEILEFIKSTHSTSDKTNTHIILSHFHYHSQSPLLALYCQMIGHRAQLLGSKKQITRGWSTSTVKLAELDKISGFKNVMASQGVSVTYYEDQKQDELENIDTQQNLQKLNIEIIDLFNTHRTLYKPYLLSHKSSSSEPNNKIYIYYIHPSQMSQIQSYLQQVPINGEVHTLELCMSFPYESTVITESKFQHQLLIFLNEELNYPNKQDIIVFHQNSEEFVKKLKNLLKKEGGDLVKHTHIIAKPSQNPKQTLPPPPSFLNKMISTMSPLKDSPVKVSSQIKSQSESSQIKTQSELKNATESAINSSKSSLTTTKQIHSHNNIYIAPNYQTLIDWRYDLSHVFYVFDFRTDQTFHFDYELMTYVETSQEYITEREALLRISCMGAHKIGKYTFVRKSQEESELIKFTGDQGVGDRKCKDIGGYCLEMIQGGYKQFWTQAQTNKDIKFCLKALEAVKILQKQQNQQYSIKRPQILKCIKKIKDLNPILCLSILQAKNGEHQEIPSSKLTILLAMATSILMTPGCLRQTSSTNNSVTNRPTQIWRQTGYLHTCIDILVRAKIIEYRQNNLQKKSKKSISRKLSKQTSQQWEVFGNLFEVIVADKITFDQMKIQDLLREEFVNQNLFHNVVDTTQKICDVVVGEIQDVVFTSFQDINFVLESIIQNVSKAIGAYSGSRRVGYLIKGQPDGIFPNKSSLLNILNQRPPLIYITRLINYPSLDSESKYEILMCNKIPEQTMMSAVGMLPNRKTNSYGETQIQYHGVASATFKALWRNNGADIMVFEDKFGCFVEPNEQIAIISIHCPKQKQLQIKQEFDQLLIKIKQKIATQTKILHYLGTTSLLFGAGGKVIQPIKDRYINKCALSNLDLEVGVQDLQQLFQEFFHLKDIKVVRQPPNAQYKTAYIEFHTQKDYYRFHEYYNECLYLNRYLKITPIQSIPAVSTYKQQMYLEFTWTAWKSNCEAIAQFENQADCLKCLESFKTVKLDGKLVKTQYKNGNKIYFSGLSAMTDEINLQSAVEVYGKVKSVEILKTPIKQNLKSLEQNLEEEIKKNVQGNVNIEVKKVEKLKNGLRKCRVIYKDQPKLNETIVALNQKTGIMGVGRIHIKSWFLYPVKVAHGYITLYQQLVAVVLNKIPNNRIKIQNTIYNEQEYIVARSNLKQQIDIFKNNINTELQGYDSTILLTEVGIRNLIDLQEKYTCRLIPDFGKKTLVVLALVDDVKTIKQEIKAKVQENFFYRISLNQKSFKYFKQHPQQCEKMKKQYNLAEFELEQIGRNLLLEGSANYVQKAFNFLMSTIQSVSKSSQEQKLNDQVCGICCQQPFRPYRLQQCGHKFCMTCLLDSVNTALNDISMFPIKCPQCLAEVAIVDLEQMLVNQTWAKLKNTALNQFVGRNPEIVSNCYTAGCKQVNFLIKNYFSCDQCQQSYCTGCKLNYHPGLTCQQAKQGGNAAFEKYMKQNGIRKCPNQSCKMPIMRLDGCYRVTCSRCNKSMCFKCQPEKMIAYDHYNDCYKHLTDVHGGYW